jgi:hypothetical protein
LSKSCNSAPKRQPNKRLKPVKTEKDWRLRCFCKLKPLNVHSNYVGLMLFVLCVCLLFFINKSCTHDFVASCSLLSVYITYLIIYCTI